MSNCKLCHQELIGVAPSELGLCEQCQTSWEGDGIRCGNCNRALEKEQVIGMHESIGPLCEDCIVEF